jgi:hypothetical protein
MRVAVLREKLPRRPFEPFRVRLPCGDTYDVRHPENALLVRSGIYIAATAFHQAALLRFGRSAPCDGELQLDSAFLTAADWVHR